MPNPTDRRWQDAVQHLLAVRRPQQAEQLIREQLARNPREVQAQVLLGFALYQQQHYPEARMAAETALSLDPAASEAHYLLCLVCSQLDLVPDTIRAIDEAVRLQPFNPKYLGARAQVYLLLNKPEEAQLAAERGLAYHPTHLDCLVQRATALRLQQRWPELADALHQLRAAHPTLPKAHLLLGHEAMRQMQFATAQNHYEEVLRQAPNDAEALQGASQAIRRQLGVGRVALWLDRYMTFISEGTKQRKLKAWGHFLLLLIPLSLLCLPLLLFMGFEAVYWRLHPAVRRLRNRPDAAVPYAQETLYRYGAALATTLLILALLPGFIWLLLQLGFPESSLGPGLTGGLTTVVMAILGIFKNAADAPVPEKSPLGWVVLALALLAASLTCAMWPATWPYGPPLSLLVASGLLYYAFRRRRARNPA